MEAVPKLPFLHFPLKTSPEPADFATPIKQFIQSHYGEQAELYSKEITELQSLRQSACRVPRDFTGCGTLKKYYSQLHLLQKRFPMKYMVILNKSKEKSTASVLFTWAHAYNPSSVSSEANIFYEQACILYNIGALHSELGAMDGRQTSEGMKISCTHFQCAAWAFQYLREGEFSISSPDMSYQMLTFNMNVMLGQAQECILEKSMLDNRKSTIVAKISAQIVDYYKEAIKILDNGGKQVETNPIANTVGSKLLKSWRKHLEFKMAYHSCVTLLYMGNQADELQKMGERLAYLQGALDKLNEAAKLAKGLDKDVNDSITFTMDVVGGKFNAASKENEFVYHEKIPSLDSLPEVKGASLVKGIPFNPDDLDISGPDIFARLVPIEAHESSSRYSEEKAKILRRISMMINEKDEELKMFLTCLQLDQLRLMPEPDRLPQELVDCCAAMSVRPTAVKQLINNMKELSGKYHDVDSLLSEIKELLTEDAKREKEYQTLTGHRPTSMMIIELSKELEKYEEAHEKAGESNVTLHKAMDYHIANLNILSGSLDQLNKALPSLEGIDFGDNGIAKEFQRLLDKIGEMQNQRKMLETMFREQLQADDITKKLVTTDNDKIQELFRKELQKHDQQVAYIEQNLAAQGNILKAVTEANARYADTRKAVSEIAQRREAMIRSLCSSFEAYEDLNTKSLKGLEFYRKLETNFTKLAQRLRSVCDVQDEQRSAVLKKKPPKKDQVEEYLAVTGPKLRDYLKFGGSKGGEYMKPNEIGAGLPYTNVNESYVPQNYVNYRQSTVDVAPTAATRYNLPSLPSELRPQPVGSEKNEPISCTTSQPPQPAATPPINTDYYGNNQTVDPVNYKIQEQYNLPAQQDYSADYANAIQNWYHQAKTFSYKSDKLSTSTAAGVVSMQQPVDNNVVSAGGYASNANQASQTGYNSSAVMYTPLSTTYSDYHTLSSSGNETNFNYQSTGGNSTPQTTHMYSVYSQQQQTPISHGGQYQAAGFEYEKPASYGGNLPPQFGPGYQTQVQYSSETQPSYSGVSQQTFGTMSQPLYSAVSKPTHNTVSQAQNTPHYNSGIQPQTTYDLDPSNSQYGSQFTMGNQPMNNLATQQQYSVEVQSQTQSQFNSASVYNSSSQSQYVAPAVAVNEPLQPQVMYYQQPLQPTAALPTSNPLQPSTISTNLNSNVELLKQLDLGTAQSVNDNVSINKTNSDKSINSTAENILKPKVVSVEELIKPKGTSKTADKNSAFKDPFSESSLPKFVSEVERFQKAVEGLTKQSLNGLTPLEQKWKELLDLQDKESKKLSISVARCYSMKNRVPDIMPYDSNRVLLTSSHDDYINASHLNNLSKNSSQYIATQAPLLATFKDFWAMIYEQQAEIVVAILSDAELRGDIYWPKDKGFSVEHGNLTVSLRNINNKTWGIERLFSVTHKETKISRTVMHLQFTGWSPGGIPKSPALFLQFISDVHTHFSEQRNSSRPLVVHCSAGVGRTGVFCLVSTAVLEINSGSGIIDLWALTGRMCQMRKYIMQDKEHMKFALHTILYYAEECLLKRGILIKRASFDEKGTATVTIKSHTRHPSQDFVIPKASDESNVEVEEAEKQQPNRSRSGSNASIASFASSSGSGTANVQTTPTHKPLPQPVPTNKSLQTHPITTTTTAAGSILPPTFSHLELENFTMEPIPPQKQNRITKESFLNPNSGVRDRQPDPNDPLSQLDPLWSLTTKK
ncbi:hypothetical protein CHUAL_008917 [Chamberlinius hualienensis]